MKQIVLFAIGVLSFMSCNNGKHTTERIGTDQSVIDEMANIDEICEIEEIIADSTLMNGKGDRAWKMEGGMIRIKNGNKYYLRKQENDGNVTTMTYRYDK